MQFSDDEHLADVLKDEEEQRLKKENQMLRRELLRATHPVTITPDSPSPVAGIICGIVGFMVGLAIGGLF